MEFKFSNGLTLNLNWGSPIVFFEWDKKCSFLFKLIFNLSNILNVKLSVFRIENYNSYMIIRGVLTMI